MCNLYSMTKSQAAIRELTRAMFDRTGNLPPLPGIFPDKMAPIVRNDTDGQRELVMARWGMPRGAECSRQGSTGKQNACRRLCRRGLTQGRTDRDFNELDRGVQETHWRTAALIGAAGDPRSPCRLRTAPVQLLRALYDLRHASQGSVITLRHFSDSPLLKQKTFVKTNLKVDD